MKKKEKKAIYIEWEDAASPENDTSWWTENGIKEWAKNFDMMICDFGWVIEENKKYIILAAGFNKGLDSYHHPIKIPKAWIRKKVDLTKYLK